MVNIEFFILYFSFVFGLFFKFDRIELHTFCSQRKGGLSNVEKHSTQELRDARAQRAATISGTMRKETEYRKSFVVFRSQKHKPASSID